MSSQEVSTARHVLEEEGPVELLLAVAQRLLPPTLAAEITLLLDERALAYPTRDDNWRVISLPGFTRGRTIPAISEVVFHTHHGSQKHLEMLKRMYTYPHFVEVEEGDTVVDVGAYVGTFSRYAARRANAVIAIDPFAAIDGSLRSNVADLDEVIVVGKAAWERPGQVEINLSSRPCDNSLLTPDSGSTGDSFQVPADTVPNILREHGYHHIDYLKVEAEGVEPEILEGALDDDMIVEKVAVDACPERNGEPILGRIRDILESQGYDCRVKQDAKWWGDEIVFGRRTGG